MKITIERFGPIQRFEYDLEKELIITYGNNNIGKSYAMQIVYLLMKAFIANRAMVPVKFRPVYLSPQPAAHPVSEDTIQNMVRDFVESEEPQKDITRDMIREVNEYICAAFLPAFRDSCKNTFGNFDKTLENKPCITLEDKKNVFVINLETDMMESEIDIETIYLMRAGFDLHESESAADYFNIYVEDDIEKTIDTIFEKVQMVYVDCVQLICGDFENVYFLPASRSGIYAGMNAFGPIVAELSKNRAYFTKKIEFPGISEPISDYFIALSDMKTEANVYLEEFCGAIEHNILKGKVAFDNNKNALIYQPDHMDETFKMTEVSSMVSEISPIVAFLKYVMSIEYEKKSILFIEEPEAHLHPGNQIALINIFARLTGANVKLILSSHSNYVFNKINNLILSGELDYHTYDPIILEETLEGSISKHIAVDELGAEDENFVDVSEALYNEREEIIEKLNMGD